MYICSGKIPVPGITCPRGGNRPTFAQTVPRLFRDRQLKTCARPLDMDKPTADQRFHIHMVSDATGETLESMAKAALVQFEGIETVKHFWPMVRTAAQMERIMQDIAEKPGMVLYTLVNKEIRAALVQGCTELKLPMVSVLDPVIEALGEFLGAKATAQPGRQHALDQEYFKRIDALDYTMTHDDGQHADDLGNADVILVGVSRTSKTPTSMYLAIRGFKVANVPFVPGCPLPPALLSAEEPLTVGLTTSPERLIQIRSNRLRIMNEDKPTDYVDLETVRQEVTQCRRLCGEHGWPVIDVTRRSIEETAASIINLYYTRAEMERNG